MTEDQRGSSHSRRARFVALPIRRPDDHRPSGCSCGPFGKVLVFCDDDGMDAKGMIPDHGIFGTGQTDVIDVLG
ncbi:MAG TPA: hypothetical protein VF435_04815 [Pyrinomonadaceae bacterium]